MPGAEGVADAPGSVVDAAEALLWPTGGQGALFAVLDGSACAEIHRRLEASGRPRRPLLRGRLAPPLLAAAPHLVELERGHPFTGWLLEAGAGRSWGIYVDAGGASFDDVCEHLRRLLFVKTERGDRLMFRFYDPRVLPVYLETCTAEELAAAFGPVERFVHEGAAPAEPWVELRRDQGRLARRAFACEDPARAVAAAPAACRRLARALVARWAAGDVELRTPDGDPEVEPGVLSACLAAAMDGRLDAAQREALAREARRLALRAELAQELQRLLDVARDRAADPEAPARVVAGLDRLIDRVEAHPDGACPQVRAWGAALASRRDHLARRRTGGSTAARAALLSLRVSLGLDAGTHGARSGELARAVEAALARTRPAPTGPTSGR